MTEKRILAIIMGLFALLGVIYAVTTPVFEASDELWHYPMIRHLADGNPLPVQVFDASEAGPWKQEASQPPLYYYLGAALTFWIDTSDMEQVRWLNPHVDNGLITADGNTNLVIHDASANPWQGTLLAVRIVRFFSVLLGATTVYLTYRVAREVAPQRPEIALGAAAVNAFTPMFLFISGAVNNDNLIIPLASLSLLLMIGAVKASRRPSRLSNQKPVISNPGWQYGRWLLLGVVIGLASLTKISGVGLLVLAWGTIFVTRWQKWEGRITGSVVVRWLVEASLRWLLVLLPVLLIAGWWYVRNLQLYGDWKGWTAFIAVLGQRPQEASLAQLWGERWGFMLSYWGLFGGVNVPMWTWIYRVLNGVVVVSVVGFIVYLFREISTWRWHTDPGQSRFSTWISRILGLVEHYFPLVICLLWSMAIVYGLVNWARITWSSQGRLVFSAISTLTTLMVVGLVGWLPRRPATWVVAGLSAFMLAVSAAAPFVWIQPAYQPPQTTPPLPQRTDINFGDRMRLVGYEVGKEQVQPGESVWVQLEWEVLQAMERDWSVFVHLNDPVLERPIAQRDMYLGQGLLATRFLQPGQRLVNSYQLHVPQTAVAPAQLELTAGLYDYHSRNQERLPVTAERDAVTLAAVALTPSPGELPNAMSVNFGNELELVGYKVSPRRAQSGDTIELLLYWRARRPLSQDYTFFAQVVDLEATTRWGSRDLGNPQVRTSTWPPEETQLVSMSFTLDEETPAEVYPIIVGVYTITDSSIEHLQLVVEDGRITQDYLLQLTPLRVDE